MSARRVAAVASLAAAAAIAFLSVGHASDHLDGPRAAADPQSDITDVFAFTSPENPDDVVLAMAVAPYAGDASTFSSAVDYAFRVHRVTGLSPLALDPTVRDVVCDFDNQTPQHVTCTAAGGLTGTAVVGDVGDGGTSGGGMRVFAGPRSDPAFFDRQGALSTVATGHASFTGINAFAGANVLAIVIELPSSTFALTLGDGAALPSDAGTDARADGASPPLPTIAVAVETVRKGS
jgi:Domain of unknown function (DUF4331)